MSLLAPSLRFPRWKILLRRARRCGCTWPPTRGGAEVSGVACLAGSAQRPHSGLAGLLFGGARSRLRVYAVRKARGGNPSHSRAVVARAFPSAHLPDCSRSSDRRLFGRPDRRSLLSNTPTVYDCLEPQFSRSLCDVSVQAAIATLEGRLARIPAASDAA